MTLARTALAAFALVAAPILATTSPAQEPNVTLVPTESFELPHEHATLRVQPTEAGWESEIEAEVTWVASAAVAGMEAEVFLTSSPRAAAMTVRLSYWIDGTFSVELEIEDATLVPQIEALTGLYYGTANQDRTPLVFSQSLVGEPNLYRRVQANGLWPVEIHELLLADTLWLTFDAVDGAGELALAKGASGTAAFEIAAELWRGDHVEAGSQYIVRPQLAMILDRTHIASPIFGRTVWRLEAGARGAVTIVEIETPNGMSVALRFEAVAGLMTVTAEHTRGSFPGGSIHHLEGLAVEAPTAGLAVTNLPVATDGTRLFIANAAAAIEQFLVADLIYLNAVADDGTEVQLTFQTGGPGRAILAVAKDSWRLQN